MKIVGPKNRLHLGQHLVFDEIYQPLFVMNSGEIWIGDYVIFGYEVKLYCGTHDYTKKNAERAKSPSIGYDIRIGNGVWIASSVIIIGPVTIGDHSVVAAGSVVKTSIPSGELWGGVPAKKIKSIEFK
jgi:acetyltransferase-like isoleucine patch superfamily enzyme